MTSAELLDVLVCLALGIGYAATVVKLARMARAPRDESKIAVTTESSPVAAGDARAQQPRPELARSNRRSSTSSARPHARPGLRFVAAWNRRDLQ